MPLDATLLIFYFDAAALMLIISLMLAADAAAKMLDATPRCHRLRCCYAAVTLLCRFAAAMSRRYCFDFYFAITPLRRYDGIRGTLTCYATRRVTPVALRLIADAYVEAPPRHDAAPPLHRRPRHASMMLRRHAAFDMPAAYATLAATDAA